jgi:hypothetical protein
VTAEVRRDFKTPSLSSLAAHRLYVVPICARSVPTPPDATRMSQLSFCYHFYSIISSPFAHIASIRERTSPAFLLGGEL